MPTDSLAEWFTTAESGRRTEILSLLVQLCRQESVEITDARTWDLVTKSARAHGLLNLLAPQLMRGAPADGAANLQDGMRYFAQRNLLLVAETQRLAVAFAEAGLDAAVFKGCLLSQMAYGASHRRQVIDLDFLVRPRDLAAAVRVLGNCGYFLDESWTPAIREGHFAYDCECCLFNAERRTCVDLHWNFTPRNYALPLRIESFFTGLRPMALHGRNVLTFSSDDQILALCIHGAKHYWQKLEWTFAIATLIRNDSEINLEKVLQRAETMGLRHIVASGLLLAQHLFLAPLPEAVARTVNANSVASEMARIAMHWVAEAPKGPPTPMQTRRFHALSRVTRSAKLSYWLGVVATPTEKDYSRPLPRILHPLYFFLRVFRLLGEAVTTPKAAYGRTLGTTPRSSCAS